MNIKKASLLTGVSDQMLRYYEKLGIIIPKRNPDNFYRDYSESDINTIVMIKQYNELGLSLKTLAALIKGGNSELAVKEINEAVRQLKLDAEWAMARLNNALHFQKLIQMMHEGNSSHVGICPKSYFYPRHDENVMALYKSLYYSEGAGKTVFRILHDQLKLEAYPKNQGMHSTKKLNDPNIEMIEIPEHKYWQTIRLVSNDQIINYRQLKPVLEQMEKEGYTLAGDIFLYQIAYTEANKGKIYICIECDIGPSEQN